jgi:hypothetical protein
MRLAAGHHSSTKNVYDLRTRLHQLLKRSLASVTLHPQKDNHGLAAVAFKDAKDVSYGIEVAKGQRTAAVVKLVKGKPTNDKRVIEVLRSPKKNRADTLPRVRRTSALKLV